MATAVQSHPQHHEGLDHEMKEQQEHFDTVQDLIRKKRLAEERKKRLQLTDPDCSIILTNANEFIFTDGQIILHEGQEISSLYWVKSGTCKVFSKGVELGVVPRGLFMGDSLFLRPKRVTTVKLTLVASGTVVLSEVNINFVKKLFAVDGLLAMKFYHNFASKLGALFLSISGFDQPAAYSPAPDEPVAVDQIEYNSTSTPPQSSPSPSPSPGTPTQHLSPSLPTLPKLDEPTRHSRCKFKRRSTNLRNGGKALNHVVYRDYVLKNNGTVSRICRLKHKKLKIVSVAFGFKKKKSIEFKKISSVTRASGDAITIIYDNLKAKTLFFKDYETLSEFLGLLNNILEQVSGHTPHLSATGTPLSSAPGTPLMRTNSNEALTRTNSSGSDGFSRGNSGSNLTGSGLEKSDTNSNSDNTFDEIDEEEEEEVESETDWEMLKTLADRMTLKKGDVLLNVGDLYQRLYCLTQGTCEVFSGTGSRIAEIPEGEVFFEATALHLRPSPVSIVVSSDEATVLVLPHYKIVKLVEGNSLLAARVARKIAQLLEDKLHRIALAGIQNIRTQCGNFYWAEH